MTYYLLKIHVITTLIILLIQYIVPVLIRTFQMNEYLAGTNTGSPVGIEELPYWKKLIYMMLYNENINISSSLWYSLMLGMGLVVTKLLSLQNRVFPGYGEQIIFIIALTMCVALLINKLISIYMYNYASDTCKLWYDNLSTHSTDYWGIVTKSSGSPGSAGSQDTWWLIKTFDEFIKDTCYIFYHSYTLPKTTSLYLVTILGFSFVIAIRLKLNQIDFTTDYGPLDWTST